MKIICIIPYRLQTLKNSEIILHNFICNSNVMIHRLDPIQSKVTNVTWFYDISNAISTDTSVCSSIHMAFGISLKSHHYESRSRFHIYYNTCAENTLTLIVKICLLLLKLMTVVSHYNIKSFKLLAVNF